MKIHKLGLFVNIQKTDGMGYIQKVQEACMEQGIQLFMLCGADGVPALSSMPPLDALLVLGGDGTILYAAHIMGHPVCPILSMNLGTLGFLTEFASDGIVDAIKRLAEGNYYVQRRILLSGRFETEKEGYTALNDIAVTRGSSPHVIEVNVFVDGEFAYRFAGDGALVASPTGSTAYSLSAGGPLVAPGLECFIVAPICPHTLSSRPMVVSSASTIRMEFSPRDHTSGMILSVDGIQGPKVNEKKALVLSKSEKQLSFIRFSEKDNFFERLHCKLSEWRV